MAQHPWWETELGENIETVSTGGNNLQSSILNFFNNAEDGDANRISFAAWASSQGLVADTGNLQMVLDYWNGVGTDTGGGGGGGGGSGGVGRVQFASESTLDFAQAALASAQAAFVAEQTISERIGRDLTVAETALIRERIISEILGRKLTEAEIALVRQRIETEKAQEGLLNSQAGLADAQTGLVGEQTRTERFNRMQTANTNRIGALGDATAQQSTNITNAIQALIAAAPRFVSGPGQTFPGFEEGGMADVLASLLGTSIADSSREIPVQYLPIEMLLQAGSGQVDEINQLLPGMNQAQAAQA